MKNKPQHLVHIFSTFGEGGPQVRASQILNILAGKYRHTIISMDGNLTCRRQIMSRVDVDYVDGSLLLRNGLFAVIKFVFFIRSLCPDIFLTYNWGAVETLPLAKLAGVRALIHTEDGFNADETFRFLWRRRIARLLIFKIIDVLVVPSYKLKHIAKHMWHVPCRKVCFIPNGVSSQKYVPGKTVSLRQQFNIDGPACVFGAVTHLTQVKDLPFMIRAFTKQFMYKKAYLLIVGDGPENKKLLQLVLDLKISDQICFVGAVENTAPYYQAMDIFLISSATEQMPVALLEAMSSGLPVVSTDVGDIKSIVSNENREFITPLNDEAAYVSSLSILFEDAARRRNIGANNRAKVISEYSQDGCVNKYDELYEQILS